MAGSVGLFMGLDASSPLGRGDVGIDASSGFTLGGFLRAGSFFSSDFCKAHGLRRQARKLAGYKLCFEPSFSLVSPRAKGLNPKSDLGGLLFLSSGFHSELE